MGPGPRPRIGGNDEVIRSLAAPSFARRGDCGIQRKAPRGAGGPQGPGSIGSAVGVRGNTARQGKARLRALARHQRCTGPDQPAPSPPSTAVRSSLWRRIDRSNGTNHSVALGCSGDRCRRFRHGLRTGGFRPSRPQLRRRSAPRQLRRMGIGRTRPIARLGGGSAEGARREFSRGRRSWGLCARMPESSSGSTS